ncbi:MAG: shikimate dehydrogenase [Methanosarcinales archaeon]|jgi:shikimate dehydrogenase|nr:shikimate dehydrogenase [Methanosarcinales archaeon]
MKQCRFGVFGFPVSHSLSPVMHSAAFKSLGMEKCEYEAYAVTPENLKQEVQKAQEAGFTGLNLTIPLKEKIFETGLIIPDEFSKKAGAVNTLHFKDGKIKGYNTDAEGAFKALEEAGCSTDGKNILIIGAGGASKSISLFFAKRGNPVKIINRTDEKSKKLAEEISEKTGNRNVFGGGFETGWADLKKADMIIQTTELGMGKYENVSVYDRLPLEKGKKKEEMIRDCLRGGKTVFDVVYNPEETKFLKESKISEDVKTLNGVMMLVCQGALAFEIWTGKKPDISVMKEAVTEALSKEKENQ